MPESTNKVESSSYKSQRATIASLSLLEKLDTIPALLSVFGNLITALFTSVLRPKDKKPSAGLYKYVMLTALRTMVRRTSVRQQHYLTPPTDDSYLAFCKKAGVEPKSEVLEDGTRAHWIGDPKAKKVVVNFHGGGYCFPASPEMFLFMHQVITHLTSQGKSVSCLFLSYDLAPGRVYPRQLQQASMLLNHILTALSIPPSNIILTGDSAGANLALAVLSHISHPHPSTSTPIPRIDLKGEKIQGAVLISPWVSFSTSETSWKQNALKDVIAPKAGQQWSSAFMNSRWPHTTNTDYYNQAIKAPASWWEGLQVDNVFVVAGEEEVLIDGIKAWEGKFEEGVGRDKVEFRVYKGEYHDQANIDLQMGYSEKDEGQQAKAIKGWIASKL